MGDSSVRFLKFLTTLPGVGCVSDTSSTFLKNEQCFTYQCISLKDLKPIMKKVLFGDKSPYEPAKPREGEKTSLRKLVPPQYTESEVLTLQRLLNDPSINFIAFPVLHIGMVPKCSAKDRHMHQSIVLYNKTTGAIELLDDIFGDVQVHYNYSKYMKSIVQDSIIPFIRTFVGKRLTAKASFPTFAESKYKTYLSLLLQHSISATFTNAYKLFLINYVYMRVAHPKLSTKQVNLLTEKEIHTANALKQYIEFEQYSNNFVQQCTTELGCGEGDTYDMSKRECVHTDKKNQCKGDAFKSLSASKPRCQNLSVEVQEKFATATPKRDIGAKTYEGIKYIVSKHANAAMVIPDDPKHDGEYMFKWVFDKNTEEWELQVPVNFEETWDVGIADPTIRFLVFLIFLLPKEGQVGHVNCMVYDKQRDELERFEPNGDSLDEDLNNGEELDDAIMEIERFEDLTYYPPASYCPRGFHSRDGREGPNVATFGGNCVIWSLWYIDVRLSNPDLPRDVLTQFTYDYIASRGSFKHFVNGYRAYLQKHITANTYSSVSTPSDFVR